MQCIPEGITDTTKSLANYLCYQMLLTQINYMDTATNAGLEVEKSS